MASSRSTPKLIRTRDLIRDGFAHPITLEELCTAVDLSKWHFLREFRGAFGETPHEFLTRVRLERAKHLLITTSRSILDICYDVGFLSPGSFGVLFRREVGQAPLAFRRGVRAMVTVPGCYPLGFVTACFAMHFGPAPLAAPGSRLNLRDTAISEKNAIWRGATHPADQGKNNAGVQR